jgi:hypothetical protein
LEHESAGDLGVRRACAEALSGGKYKNSVSCLAQCLSDEDEEFVEYSALGLAKLGDNRAVPTLLKLLSIPQKYDHAIIEALCYLRARPALPALIEEAKSATYKFAFDGYVDSIRKIDPSEATRIAKILPPLNDPLSDPNKPATKFGALLAFFGIGAAASLRHILIFPP